ncbi:fructosamine kinase family protein [Kineosporia sp. A_224]|uniref:fructosamine kinase family protein n=1 Tax=Kineosporia sp. A_224 TaxID=1962180 RepID=UPI001E3F56A4|nr:fructosamine kinase family protein [Kineosporia sp. A_224]
MPDAPVFTKRRAAAPRGFFAAEASGLAWLDEAAREHGGVPVVRPLEVHRDRLVLPLLGQGRPAVAAAHTFGRRLAATHAAGADRFGAPPAGLTGDGWIGPLELPHVHDPEGGTGWGPFYATHRLAPYVRAARDAGALTPDGARAIDRVCSRLAAGDPVLCGPPEPPARLHGDLWSGNVLWTPSGVVLVDPAAHGGHRETDLAMLALFGLPHLDAVLAGYDGVAPLAAGWQERVPLHQLHPLLVHAVLFGSSFGAQAAAVARRFG